MRTRRDPPARAGTAAIALRAVLCFSAALLAFALTKTPAGPLPAVPDVSVRSSASVLLVTSDADARGKALAEALLARGHRVSVLLCGPALKHEEAFGALRGVDVRLLVNAHALSGSHVDAARSFQVLEKIRGEQADVVVFAGPAALALEPLQARAQGLALPRAAVALLLPSGPAPQEHDRHAGLALRLADAAVAPDAAAASSAAAADADAAGGHIYVDEEPSGGDGDAERWARWVASLQPREAPAPAAASAIPWEAQRAAEAGEPAVSVVITHRDQPVMLRAALRSLKQQTFKALEVILVDAGSTSEETEGYLADLESAWREEGAGWTILRRSDSSLAGARSAGAALARAPYILLMARPRPPARPPRPRPRSTEKSPLQESNVVLKLNAVEKFLAPLVPRRAHSRSAPPRPVRYRGRPAASPPPEFESAPALKLETPAPPTAPFLLSRPVPPRAAGATRATLLASHVTLIHADFAFRRLPSPKDVQHDAVLSAAGDPLTRCLADSVLFAGRQAVLSAARGGADPDGRDAFARAADSGRPVAVVADSLYWLRWSGDAASPPFDALRDGSWEGCLAKPAPASEKRTRPVSNPVPEAEAPAARRRALERDDESDNDASSLSPREAELKAYLASLRAAYEGRKVPRPPRP
eukprot:tig00000269_g23755.t1